eukprot:7097111-Prymnesium_polylepis.1
MKGMAAAATMKNQFKRRQTMSAVIAKDDDESGKASEPLTAPKTQGPKDAKTRDTIRVALKNNFLFRHLDDAGIDGVMAYMLPHPVKRGDAIIKQGDKGDYFYVCQSGKYDVLIDRK